MDYLSLREIQEAEHEILSYFDRICRDNDIKYSLGGGTLLGAIRHKGFIPWDDDIDIYMKREEYERFISILSCSPNNNYSLLYVGSSALYTNVFSKIINKQYKLRYVTKDSNQQDLEDENYIWIDIFPLDDEPNNTIIRKVYHKIIKYLHQSRNAKRNQKPCANQVKNIRSAHRVAVIWNMFCKLFKNKNSRYYNLASFSSAMNDVFPKEWMQEYIEADFEGKKYFIFREYEKILRQSYGDYMTPPPEEARIPIHNFIVYRSTK